MAYYQTFQPYPYQDQLNQLRTANPMPMQGFPPMQARPDPGGLNWVQGEAGAKSWYITPGSTVLLMDSEGMRFYLKSADLNGVPAMRTFEYNEVGAQKPQDIPQPVNFVTMEEFTEFKNEVLNNAITGGFNGVERQIADCCCTTQRAIDGVNFNMAKGFCDLGNVMNSNTRDILENQNTNTRAILDFLTNDKIATLTAENQSLKLSASQANQNAVLMAAMDANKAEILRRTGAECPTPAYVVQPPTPVNFPVNGCGNFYGWNNNCGCG